MKERGRRWMGTLALATGAFGAVGATLWLMRKKSATPQAGATAREATARSVKTGDAWARPGMDVTFRAELMPGRDRAERTFRVMRLLSSKRVELEGVAGEHTETEFEPLRFRRAS